MALNEIEKRVAAQCGVSEADFERTKRLMTASVPNEGRTFATLPKIPSGAPGERRTREGPAKPKPQPPKPAPAKPATPKPGKPGPADEAEELKRLRTENASLRKRVAELERQVADLQRQQLDEGDSSEGEEGEGQEGEEQQPGLRRVAFTFGDLMPQKRAMRRGGRRTAG